MALQQLILIRHGESVGNVAASAAQLAGADVIDVGFRDPDVPLSSTGREQATALGAWLARAPRDNRPQLVLSSPYRRAQETAELAGLAGGALRVDERLRDRELGVLDLLTAAGVAARFPEEAQRREWLGKFYYRPPGGESWTDVALRLRSLLADIERLSAERVALVCHDAIILLLRYVCEGLTEAELLAIASSTAVRNGSVTRLVRSTPDGPWDVASFNEVGHLEAAGAPITEHAGDTNVHPT
jgi:broad specificity phosphatase PhoE